MASTPAPPTSTRTDRLIILGFVALALVLRLASLPRDAIINSDGIYYATLGEALRSGDLRHGISTYWSPLYPLLIAIASVPLGDVELAGRVVSALAGAALIVPAFLLVRQFYGRVAAAVVAALIALHPALIESSTWVMSDALYALLFTAVVLTGWLAARDGSPRMALATGLLLGAAYLTRPEAVAFVALYVGWLLVLQLVGVATARRPRAVLTAAVLVVGFAVLAVPYVMVLHQRTGRWTISEKADSNVPSLGGHRGLLQLTEDGRTTRMDQLFSGDEGAASPLPADAWTAVVPPPEVGPRRVPESTIQRAARQLWNEIREYMPIVVPRVFAIVGVLGFALGLRRTREWFAQELYLLSIFGATLLGYALTVVELRYVYAVLPILLAWVARGVVEMARVIVAALSRTADRPRVTPAIAAGVLSVPLVVLLAVQGLRGRQRPVELRSTPLEERAAGLWLREHADSSALVISPSPTITYYANTRHLYVPNEPLRTVIAYARHRGAKYLVLSERRASRISRVFQGGTDSRDVPLPLLHEVAPAPGFRVRVYRVSE